MDATVVLMESIMRDWTNWYSLECSLQSTIVVSLFALYYALLSHIFLCPRAGFFLSTTNIAVPVTSSFPILAEILQRIYHWFVNLIFRISDLCPTVICFILIDRMTFQKDIYMSFIEMTRETFSKPRWKRGVSFNGTTIPGCSLNLWKFNYNAYTFNPLLFSLDVESSFRVNHKHDIYFVPKS